MFTKLFKSAQKYKLLCCTLTFFVSSPKLVKVGLYFFWKWKEIWQRIQICHWFCCRRLYLHICSLNWIKLIYQLDHPVCEDCKTWILKFDFVFILILQYPSFTKLRWITLQSDSSKERNDTIIYSMFVLQRKKRKIK